MHLNALTNESKELDSHKMSYHTGYLFFIESLSILTFRHRKLQTSLQYIYAHAFSELVNSVFNIHCSSFNSWDSVPTLCMLKGNTGFAIFLTLPTRTNWSKPRSKSLKKIEISSVCLWILEALSVLALPSFGPWMEGWVHKQNKKNRPRSISQYRPNKLSRWHLNLTREECDQQPRLL